MLSKEEGDNIVLECQLKDYYPDKLSVQWLSGIEVLRDNNNKKLQTTGGGQKNFTYISQISISAQYEDKDYTCEATHNSKVFEGKYSMCECKLIIKINHRYARNDSIVSI